MNLETEYLGMHFENPFVLASAPTTATGDMIERAFDQGWAGAVIKTLIPEQVRNVSNRFATLKLHNQLMAFQNFELLSERGPEEWYRDIRKLKENYPDKIVISSIMEDARDPDQWIQMAKCSQDAGADMVELNFSCPHGYPEKGKGAAIGQNADYAASIVGWIRESGAISIPLIPKLTAAAADISHIGEAVAKAGARGLCAINTVPSFMGFDLKTLTPKASVAGRSTTGGYSGPGIKPLALRCAYELAKSPGLPLMASGGIFSGFDAAEFMLLGAPIVQVCTAVMWEGYGIVSRLRQELMTFMSWHRFSCINDFLGKGLELVVSHAELDHSYHPAVRVDRERCAACGKCMTSCTDAGHQALELRDGRIHVDESRCVGCSLCMHVCTRGAIQLQQRSGGYASAN